MTDRYGPTNANCNRMLRWMAEKLSSDTMVRIVSPCACGATSQKKKMC